MSQSIIGFAFSASVLFVIIFLYAAFRYASPKRSSRLNRPETPRSSSVQSSQGSLSSRSSAYSLAPPTETLPWNNPSVVLDIHQDIHENRPHLLNSPPPTYQRNSPPPTYQRNSPPPPTSPSEMTTAPNRNSHSFVNDHYHSHPYSNGSTMHSTYPVVRSLRATSERPTSGHTYY